MKRVMRFVGNREKPEKSLYDPFSTILHPERLIPVDLSNAKDIPNPLFSDFEDSAQPGSLFHSTRPPEDQVAEFITYSSLIRGNWKFTRSIIAEQSQPELPIEEPFETNLTEPLVGWRTWNMAKGRLYSLYHEVPWLPDTPFKAICTATKCVHSPTTNCECGIYAITDYDSLGGYLERGNIAGMVLGWGRYVRGNNGWRSEFAYPSKFLISSNRMCYVDDLKKYHVPIYVWEPMRLYDPQEDGYEYWRNEEDWHFRAGAGPNAEEDDDPGED